MSKERFLQRQRLTEWLTDLGRERKVLVPVREGGSVVFRPFAGGGDPVLSMDATIPPKGAVFPSCHELFGFEQGKDPENPEHISLTLSPKIRAVPTLVFGARPCGARGFSIFDKVYSGEKFPDPYYLTSRENTLLVTLACTRADNTCFCHWVGGGPDDPTGSDILMTPVEEGYVVEAVSERGEALLDSPFFVAADGRSEEAVAVRAQVKKSLGPAPDISRAPASLLALFDDLRFWEDVSAKCISCGACTYLCPTCYCFSITDEACGATGKRLRSWDTCMSFQFTMEASGHNPRPTKAHRLRNRVGHKFSYYPTLHDNLTACCGCGRCIKSCPASVDIREIVLKAIDRTKDQVREVSDD